MLCTRRLHIPIRDEGTRIGWGLWCRSMTRPTGDSRRVDDPNQAAEPPFPCTIANDVPNYASTRGLPA